MTKQWKMLTRIILKDLLTCFQLNWGLRLQPWTAASLVYVSVSLVCCHLQNQAVLTLPQVFMNSSRLYRTCKQQANLSLLWLPKLALMQGVVLLFYSPSPRHAKTMSLLYVSCYTNVYSCSALHWLFMLAIQVTSPCFRLNHFIFTKFNLSRHVSAHAALRNRRVIWFPASSSFRRDGHSSVD